MHLRQMEIRDKRFILKLHTQQKIVKNRTMEVYEEGIHLSYKTVEVNPEVVFC